MLARPNDITKFIEVEITKIREDYKRNLTIVIEEPAGSEDPNTYPFYIVMYTMNREEGLNRHPLCWIGDKDLSFPGDFSLQESLQGSFTFFNEAMIKNRTPVDFEKNVCANGVLWDTRGVLTFD